MRLQQEILLGIGGVRIVRALGLHPAVWHLNEGHSAFMVLERLKEYVSEGRTGRGREVCPRRHGVHHTYAGPPAGHDTFEASRKVGATSTTLLAPDGHQSGRVHGVGQF